MSNLAHKFDQPPDADLLIARLNTDLMLIKLQSDNLMVMLDEQRRRDADIPDPELARAVEVDE